MQMFMAMEEYLEDSLPTEKGTRPNNNGKIPVVDIIGKGLSA